MPDRMHIPKVMQIEVVGWYRENSVRFVRMLAPRPIASLFFSLVAVPLTVLHWATYAKVREHELKGEPVPSYQVLPRFKMYGWHGGENGGHAPDYRGPEEWMRFEELYTSYPAHNRIAPPSDD